MFSDPRTTWSGLAKGGLIIVMVCAIFGVQDVETLKFIVGGCLSAYAGLTAYQGIRSADSEVHG